MTFPYPVSSAEKEYKENRIKKIYSSALKLESRHKFKKALNLYRVIINFGKDENLAKESFFRMAVIYDEKFFIPSKAVKSYENYLQMGGGRNNLRAKGRIRYLSPYLNVNEKIFKEYISILNSDTGENTSNTLSSMETFVKNNPQYKRLDDALFWIANEKKGYHRGIIDKRHKESILSSINLYEKILKDFPDSVHTISVLKNLGDCFKMLGKRDRAEEYYKKASQMGGESKVIIDDYLNANNFEKIEKRIFIFSGAVIIFIAPLLLGFSYPGKKLFSEAVKKGLYYLAFYIPAPVIFIIITFIVTDSSKDNHLGTEPYLMILLSLIPVFGIFIHSMRELKHGKDPQKSKSGFLFISAIFYVSSIYTALYSTGYHVIIREALR